MPHFIKFFNPTELDTTLLKQLHYQIKKDVQEFQPSLLYSETDVSKIFDLDRRKISL